MAQQFDYPKTETELRKLQDKLYQHSKKVYDEGGRPALKGLLEIMSAEATIITAIHNIKSNHGSETPGVDSKTMRDYLQHSHSWVIRDIQSAFKHFEPQKIRRVYIDKPGKAEKRPLGIPTIRDRIVQECMRIVLEPIFEAQFFAHSYGFRPMRDAPMALERAKLLVHHTGYHWIVEGDISKCFDRIDHAILLKRLYHMGIRDRRVLQIIKAMLKTGVMDECEVNEEGTPQGGLISPLLANVYLDIMDEWITKQWEIKKTEYPFSKPYRKYKGLRRTALIPGFLVRYADDFIIITDTRAHAEDWKKRLQIFLHSKMKLTLSPEKTLITDIRKKYIKFLGYEYKVVPGKARKGYIPRTIPERDRLRRKTDKIAHDIKKIPHYYGREQMVDAINRINSQIRGIIQYYQCCTWVNISMKKYSRRLQFVARRRLTQYKGKWIPAIQTQNLPRVHQQYKQKIPSMKYRDIYIGFTALSFCKWEKTIPKKEEETPYTEAGRQLFSERTKKQRINARFDELYSEKSARAISYGKWGKLNNFEFIMNRAYALNRDKLKCRVCGGWLISSTPWAHRVNPYLPLDKVNCVNNLVSLHKKCFMAVNNPNQEISQFDVKAQKKIIGYREKLVPSHTRNK
ncbi:group II intron reverse transcriptase/maturase [Lawsonibacter sp. JLR.KK007]|uniref:group II intron reverse transcriptase/maturase n=1 Tax=Lawsonibacter sp. JLR.KK007 TaxID=3114293 RepID=UPI002FF025F8